MKISEQLFVALIEDVEEVVQQLLARIRKLQMHASWEEMADFKVWFEREFPVVFGGRIPKGMKSVRDEAQWFAKAFFIPDPQYRDSEGLDGRMKEISTRWARLEDKVDLLARHFSKGSKGGQKSELKIGGITVRNDAGVSGATLKRYAGSLAAVFGKVKGWRHKALQGGLTVVLAPATAFRGGASGLYKRDRDEMLVRATPKVMSRLGKGSYGSPEYILIHELGHRYEAHHPLPVEFNRGTWYTTRYSYSEGLTGSEPFAELFALGHFGITKAHQSWDLSIQTKFEKVMTGGRIV